MIFTFDGDSAGRKAAERAFADDQKFMSYTFVAIEPNGLDPCELRQKSGDAAVRDLVARRVPLVQFVLKSSVDRFDLETAEGRSAALDVGVPLVAQIKDQSLRVDYSQVLARMVGIDDPDRVLTRVRGMARGGRQSPERPTRAQPPVDDAVASVEREVLKVAMQLPAVAGPSFDALVEDAFLLPAHRQLRAAVAAAGGSANAVTGAAWAERVSENLPDEPSRALVHALAVEPLHAGADSQERYADAVIARLHEIVLARQIAVLKSRLQRTNPIEAAEEHARMFGELIALESQRRTMRDRAIGSI
jgi:DNA primase